MVEQQRALNFTAHVILILGVALVVLPVWVVFVTSTHPQGMLLSGRLGLLPGDQLSANYSAVLTGNIPGGSAAPVWQMLINSVVMALGIAVGKIIISLTAAYAIVYYRFRFRMLSFWLIFITLMLPVEVRILPTYEVIADLNMLNSYSGLIIPLIASATATFLFRQFFLTVPDELLEAARIDGAGPIKFFWDILLPLSRTNIAALFVILFIYGWNQYLWPLLITTDQSWYTVVMGLKTLVTESDEEPRWHLVSAATILAMLPPIIVVIAMQKLFVKGLVETEK